MENTAGSLALATSVLLGECWRPILEKPRAKSLYLYIRADGKNRKYFPAGGQAEGWRWVPTPRRTAAAGSFCCLQRKARLRLLALLPSHQRSTSASGYRGVNPSFAAFPQIVVSRFRQAIVGSSGTLTLPDPSRRSS